MNRWALIVAVTSGCIEPGSDRARLDDEVGAAVVDDLGVIVADGQAQVRSLTTTELRLWAQAPTVSIVVDNRGGDVSGFEITIENALLDGELAAAPETVVAIERLESPRPPVQRYAVDLPGAAIARLEFRSPDLGEPSPFRFAVMGDIQTALDRVDEVFDVINEQPNLEFVMSTGDLVEGGGDDEYELLDRQLEVLDLPFYSTIGNHELTSEADKWHRRFGRFSVHFVYREVGFSFVDSGNASLNPIVGDRLEAWLDESRGRVHFFGTHYPPVDPIGTRNASFRSRKEAAALIARLAEGAIDIAFYGHIHSFYAYSNAGIPAFISGGGGAIQERWDGVGRHFLVADVDPLRQTSSVSLIRVD